MIETSFTDTTSRGMPGRKDRDEKTLRYIANPRDGQYSNVTMGLSIVGIDVAS